MEIILDGMEFYAFHGVMDEEKRIGGRYVVNLCVTVPDRSGADDCLESTINYQELYDTVRDVLVRENANLIEYLAQRVIHEIHERFVLVTDVKLHLYKYNPPIGGRIERAGIYLCG